MVIAGLERCGEDRERPLCNEYGGRRGAQLPGVAGRRCTALTAEGKRCRMWAMEDDEKRFGRPLCMVHGGAGAVGVDAGGGRRAVYGGR